MAASLALAASLASAQTLTGRVHASRDSDGFHERIGTLGYTSATGWGLKAGAARYSGASGWSADGAVLAATYRTEDVTRQLDVSLGAFRLDGRTHAVGGLDYLRKNVAPGSSLGLSVERDIVNSQGGIDNGLSYNSAALVADHRFNKRFNVGAAAGATWFSDDNRRPFLRTRWNFELEERWALNAYLKTRHYENTRPGRAEYYSPERLGELSLGLSTRFLATASIVLSAQLDGGHQSTEANSQPIWSYSIGASAARSSRVRWRVALQAANTTSIGNAGGDYRYTSLLAHIDVPL